MYCVRCKKRAAVVFVQRLENGKPIQEGYCLTCAREMHIKPVDDLMKQFGMSDQDLETMEERMSSFLQEASDSAAMTLSDNGESPEQEDFVPGGSPTFPFNFLMNRAQPEGESAEKSDQKSKKEKRKKYKFLRSEEHTSELQSQR